MADPIPVDQDGNPIFPLEEELLLELGLLGVENGRFPVFNDGNGTENNGDPPRLIVL